MSMIWIKAALVRALKTTCQTAASLLAVSTVMQEVDWKMVASASLLPGILSLLTSIGGLPEVKMEEQIEDDLSCKPELPDDYYEPEIEENENE